MDVRLKFLGGAQTVTGSKYLLEIDDYRLLVDCGLFQGLKEYRLRNWDDFPVDASSIDAIILTHAHIDHSGYLPRIVKEGFSGPVYCTSASAALLDIMLKDAAKLQEEEAEFARKKGYSKHKKPLPLFDSKDAQLALSLLESAEYGSEVSLTPSIQFKYRDAGHILGSAIIELSLLGTSQTKKIAFSGDLGRFNQSILNDPDFIQQTDILLIESTYGDRLNTADNINELFAEKINSSMNKGGVMLIPSFAVGRTQQVLFLIQHLIQERLIPEIPVYLDSPMAISATSLYARFPGYHKLNSIDGVNVFDSPIFHYYRSQEYSINLNEVKSNAIIISASGMCTGGRILHHLFHRLGRKTDTLLFVGYQAIGTRGRRILEGEPTSRIFGIDVPVRCSIDYLNGLSAHADKEDLVHWLSHFRDSPKMTFIIHGEEKSSNTLAKTIQQKLQWNNVIIPEYLESFQLFTDI